MSLEPFLGEIGVVAFNFAPRGWALCNGQLLPINQNQALFSLLGTTYGGNGTTTFALPDLRGRMPVHWGQGPGLANVGLGESGGTEAHTLSSAELPIHTHLAFGDASSASTGSPDGNTWAAQDQNPYSLTPNTSMNPASILPAGGNQAHANLQPYLALTFVIAMVGIFPSRD